MAAERKTTGTQAKKTVSPDETANKYESKYSIEELAAASQHFNAKQVFIRAALKNSGKTKFTLKEAEKIIRDFK